MSDEFLSLVNLSKAKGVTKDILIQQMKQEQGEDLPHFMKIKCKLILRSTFPQLVTTSTVFVSQFGVDM